VTQQSLAPMGTVVSLWRYPVKSMMGEEINSSYITERGLVGDRTYAVVDKQTGKIASAKNPRKWGKLFDFRSIFVDSPQDVNDIPRVRITFPNGINFLSNNHREEKEVEDDINSSLSQVFNRQVALMKSSSFENPNYEEYWPDINGLAQREKITDEAMPSNSFFDIAVIHILTTSTINRLRELYPQGRFEVRRFRPNIVIESGAKEMKNDFIENTWVGKKMIIGKDVVLNVTAPCTRCVMITLPQGDLPQDLGILKTVAKYNQVHVGVYASVERGGTIHRGDTIEIE
jgi:MOSC domain-containing protein